MRALRSAWVLGGLVAGMTVAVVVTAILVLGSFIQDPGEGLFTVQVVNDMPSEMVVQVPCGTDQRRCQYETFADLLPGASMRVEVSDRNVDQNYRVVDAGGHLVGCLPLRFDHMAQGAVVNLSGAIQPCARSVA